MTILIPVSGHAESVSAGDIYDLAVQGNVSALKEVKESLDAVEKNGQTALCRSITDKNYAAYHHLKTAGANTNHPCTQDIPKNDREAFQNRYQNWIKEVSEKSPSLLSGGGGLSIGTITGIGVGAMAVAGVAVAAGGGGGGGGGGSHSSSVISSAWGSTSASGYSSLPSDSFPLPDHTLTQAATFETGDSHYGVGRFLPVINAATAYEKFIPVKTENDQIVSYDTGALDKIRVAVMDTGVNANNTNINFATKNGKVLEFDYKESISGHGTHVAGLIAGKWNGDSHTVNGVAPNAQIV
ncbi:MAG: S8 family serine peptidase, partial [Pseudomonadota bacterium]|nr:S8 family serine peptidase [Pseudomonadota bacterium]